MSMGGRGRAVRRRLLAGLVVIAPAGITAYVVWWIFRRLDGLLGQFLYPAIGRDIPGLGLLLLLLILFGVGWATERAIGARVLGLWHALLERLPLARRLYGAVNRVVGTVLGQDRRFFRQVVLVEYPSTGLWSIGFVTGKALDAAPSPTDEKVTVFIPTVPNPTTGFLVMVPRDKTIVLRMTLEEAFTYILSAGAVRPGGELGAPPNAAAREAM